MIEFTTPSEDGTELSGRHWPVDNPKAVMAIVHGFGEHCGRYADMAAHLNAQAIAVLAVDLHGHGKTPGARGVVKDYSVFRADVSALLRRAQSAYPDSPMVLYGHSMGGGIVLNYGSRHLGALPILASAPLLGLTKPIPAFMRFVIKALSKILPKGAVTEPIDGTKISNLIDEQTLYLEDPLNHGTLGYRLAVGMVETGERLVKQAEDWDRPLLLMHSKADQLTQFERSEEFAKTAKQVEFHPFETSQHEMHNDAPRVQIYDLITEFTLRQTS